MIVLPRFYAKRSVRYPGVRVRRIVKELEDGNLDSDKLALEFKQLSIGQLRQLGRELLAEGDNHKHLIEAVRLEIASR